MSEQSAEALYQSGMAHYQKREWRPALDKFRQLKAAQPERPGLDALIDEVSWFLQLEQVGETGAGSRPEDDLGHSTSVAPTERRARQPRSRLRWLAPLLLSGIALAVIAVWRGLIPGLGLGRTQEQETLSNRGQASLAVGDFAAAREAFAELARLSSGDARRAAQEGLQRAQQLEALAQAEQEAQTAIEAGDWDTAEDRLRTLLAANPADAGLSERLSFVERQRQASALFAAGVAAYDRADTTSAIEQLERLAEFDAAYQHDTVRELLFILYMQDGDALVASPNVDAGVIRQAIGRFGQALALRPRNVQAAGASQLANQYLSARQALDREDWEQARSLLGGILRQQPGYAGGQAGEWLYQLLLRQGDAARAEGQTAQAQRAYEQALDLPAEVAPDRSAALAGLQAIAAQRTPTPASLPTAEPQPTPSVRVEAPTLNVRLGPATDFPLIGQATAGDQLALVGRNEAGDWLVVCCIDGQPGWVATRLVTLAPDGFDIALLPVGLAPPRPPSPTPLPSFTPTLIATATATPTVEAAQPPPSQPEPPTPTFTPQPR